MEGDDRKELARQRLSCFADSLMTDYSLSKAAVIRAMKAYIASNKQRIKMLKLKSVVEIWHGQRVAYPIPRAYQVPFCSLFLILQ